MIQLTGFFFQVPASLPRGMDPIILPDEFCIKRMQGVLATLSTLAFPIFRLSPSRFPFFVRPLASPRRFLPRGFWNRKEA